MKAWRKARNLIAYTRQALYVLRDMQAGLITSEQAGREIDRLRRQYGLRDLS